MTRKIISGNLNNIPKHRYFYKSLMYDNVLFSFKNLPSQGDLYTVKLPRLMEMKIFYLVLNVDIVEEKVKFFIWSFGKGEKPNLNRADTEQCQLVYRFIKPETDSRPEYYLERYV